MPLSKSLDSDNRGISLNYWIIVNISLRPKGPKIVLTLEGYVDQASYQAGRRPSILNVALDSSSANSRAALIATMNGNAETWLTNSHIVNGVEINPLAGCIIVA